MKARISKPAKTATQSGLGKTEEWLLEYEPVTGRKPEPLMGWTASGDTTNQVRLKFSTLEEAKEFAEKKGMEYTVRLPHQRKVRPRNYGDNFKYVAPEE
jgi:hypothetical protein